MESMDDLENIISSTVNLRIMTEVRGPLCIYIYIFFGPNLLRKVEYNYFYFKDLFYSEDFILLFRTAYIKSCYLKFLNDMTT